MPLYIGAYLADTQHLSAEQSGTKFMDSSQKASDAADASLQKIATSMWASTDALRVTNDQLDIAFAKMTGKQPNNLALELDEARVAADRLADSLSGDQQKIGAVLTANQSWWHTLIGQGRTAPIEGAINYMTQQIADQGNQQRVDLHNNDQGAAKKDRQDLDASLAYTAQRCGTTSPR